MIKEFLFSKNLDFSLNEMLFRIIKIFLLTDLFLKFEKSSYEKIGNKKENDLILRQMATKYQAHKFLEAIRGEYEKKKRFTEVVL